MAAHAHGATGVLPTTLRTAALGVGVLLLVLPFAAPRAHAAEPPVDLGKADTYSVLAGTAVTNTLTTTLSGDLGLSPGDALTGFPPGVVNGATHVADLEASLAQSDFARAFDDADGRTQTQPSTET